MKNVKDFFNDNKQQWSNVLLNEKKQYNIIEKFLSKNDNFVVEKVESKLNCYKSEFGLTFLPQISLSAGFYFCKLKRVK